jgi:hypothetical protein
MPAYATVPTRGRCNPGSSRELARYVLTLHLAALDAREPPLTIPTESCHITKDCEDLHKAL